MEKKKPNKHSFPLQEEATEQTHVVFPISLECNPSCYFHICKTTETDYFPRESCDWTPPLPPRPRPFSGDGGQEAAGGRCSLLSETSCAVDKHHFPNIEWTVNAKKEACSRSHHLHPEMNDPEQHAFQCPNPPTALPVEHESCQIIQNRFSTWKVIIHVVIKIQTDISL